jgi:hypothetical protein
MAALSKSIHKVATASKKIYGYLDIKEVGEGSVYSKCFDVVFNYFLGGCGVICGGVIFFFIFFNKSYLKGVQRKGRWGVPATIGKCPKQSRFFSQDYFL